MSAAAQSADSSKYLTPGSRAATSGARYAVIVGEDEAAARAVSIKPLRESGEQRTVPARDVVNALTPAAPTRAAD